MCLNLCRMSVAATPARKRRYRGASLLAHQLPSPGPVPGGARQEQHRRAPHPMPTAWGCISASVRPVTETCEEDAQQFPSTPSVFRRPPQEA